MGWGMRGFWKKRWEEGRWWLGWPRNLQFCLSLGELSTQELRGWLLSSLPLLNNTAKQPLSLLSFLWLAFRWPSKTMKREEKRWGGRSLPPTASSTLSLLFFLFPTGAYWRKPALFLFSLSLPTKFLRWLGRPKMSIFQRTKFLMKWSMLQESPLWTGLRWEGPWRKEGR